MNSFDLFIADVASIFIDIFVRPVFSVNLLQDYLKRIFFSFGVFWLKHTVHDIIVLRRKN